MSVWDEVASQPHAVETLQRAVSGSRPGSADAQTFTNSWLITGPAGSGRSTCAYAFAAALLCPQGGCGECQSCVQVRARSHPDLDAVVTDTVILSIDTARELVGRASRSPTHANYRVIVVEDADRMIERTSNALLKAIEEPVESTVWVLCAPSVADLLPTIRSRVRVVPLGTPKVEDVAELLVRRHNVDRAVALRAARESQSHVGMASRLVTSPEAWQRREESLAGVLALRSTGQAVRKAAELVALAEADGKAAAEAKQQQERAQTYRSLGLSEDEAIPRQLRSVFRELEDQQKRRAKRATLDGVDRILTDFQSLWRDVLMLQVDAPVELVNEAVRSEIVAAAARMAPEHAVACLEAIERARERLMANVPPALALEALLLDFISEFE